MLLRTRRSVRPLSREVPDCKYVVPPEGLEPPTRGLGKGGVELGRCQPTWITVHPVLWVPDRGWQRVTPRAHTRAHAGSSWSRVWSGSRLELGQSRRRDGLRRWTRRWILTDRTEGGSKAMEFILPAKEVFDQVDGPPAAVLVGNRNVDRSWIRENHPGAGIEDDPPIAFNKLTRGVLDPARFLQDPGEVVHR